MERYNQKIKFLVLLCVNIMLIASFASFTYSGEASPVKKTLMQSRGIQEITTTNTTNIVLVHGAWADGSSWSKVIPILENAGHKVIAVQMSLHSLSDDIATVKRAVELVGGPPNP